MMGNEKIIFFKHRPGDGVHYITATPTRFKDGATQRGDTSEGCILFNLDLILSANHIHDRLHTLWNQVYPDDLMSAEDEAYIIGTAVTYTHTIKGKSLEEIQDVLRDVREMGCHELADLVEIKLRERDIHV